MVKRRTAIGMLLASCTAVAGCADFANTRNFAAVGTVLGAGAGVAIGAATGHVTEGVLIGAGLGGLGGGLAGSQMENYQRKKVERELLQGVQQDMLSVADPIAGKGPGRWEIARRPKWVDTSQKRRVWVEEKVVDGKLIPAHFEERVIPAGYWVEEEEKVWIEEPRAGASRAP